MDNLLQDNTEDDCHLEHNPLEVGISVFIAFGLLVSYLPQHYRIIRIKTSEGLNPIFLLLGTLSATSSLFNIIVLQFKLIQCCATVSATECVENTLGIIQLSIQWTCFLLVFILFLAYFPPSRKLAPYIPHMHYGRPPSSRSHEWNVSVRIAYAIVIHYALTLAITVFLLVFVGPEEWQTRYWAAFLGLASMAMASVQYLPQIYTTWKRKSVGALSIPMMLIQTPGSFLFVYSLAIRPGANWTTWIVFLVTGCLQGTLLVMSIVWHFRNKRRHYGPFNVTDADYLVGRDGRRLVPEGRVNERSGLLNGATRAGYNGQASPATVEES